MTDLHFDHARPARAPRLSPGNLIARLFARRRLAPLADLSDHMLSDIGVTRADVERARNLPLSVDAGLELERIALQRRARPRR